MSDPFDVLAPWDASTYFQAITETTYTMTGLPIQVVVGDPMTVALVFGLGGASPSGVAISTKSTVGQNKGMMVQTAATVLILKYADVGPLVQQSWWAWGALNAVLTVVQVKLRTWPARPRRRKES